MANPKMKACPCCDNVEHLAVYKSGWRYVECFGCNYLGPGERNIRQAIRSHNIQRDERRAKHLAALAANPGAVRVMDESNVTFTDRLPDGCFQCWLGDYDLDITTGYGRTKDEALQDLHDQLGLDNERNRRAMEGV